MIKIKDTGLNVRCNGKYGHYQARKIYFVGILIYSHTREIHV